MTLFFIVALFVFFIAAGVPISFGVGMTSLVGSHSLNAFRR